MNDDPKRPEDQPASVPLDDEPTAVRLPPTRGDDAPTQIGPPPTERAAPMQPLAEINQNKVKASSLTVSFSSKDLEAAIAKRRTSGQMPAVDDLDGPTRLDMARPVQIAALENPPDVILDEMITVETESPLDDDDEIAIDTEGFEELDALPAPEPESKQAAERERPQRSIPPWSQLNVQRVEHFLGGARPLWHYALIGLFLLSVGLIVLAAVL